MAARPFVTLGGEAIDVEARPGDAFAHLADDVARALRVPSWAIGAVSLISARGHLFGRGEDWSPEHPTVQVLVDRKRLLSDTRRAINIEDSQVIVESNWERNPILADDEEIIVSAMRRFGASVFQLASPGMRGDARRVLSVMRWYHNWWNDDCDCHYVMRHASQAVRGDARAMLAAVRIDARAMLHFHGSCSCRILAGAAVRRLGVDAFPRLDSSVFDEPRLLFGCLLRASRHYMWQGYGDLASELANLRSILPRSRFLDDERLVRTAVGIHPMVFALLPRRLRKDRALALAAVGRCGIMLRYAAPELRDDAEVVLAAVENRGEALRHASRALREDRRVVAAAVQNDCLALRHAGRRFRDDIALILQLAAINQDVVGCASRALRKSADALLALLAAGYHMALRHATRSLRRNRLFMLRAARVHGRAVAFMDETLRSDVEIFSVALDTFSSAVDFMSPFLFVDKDLMMRAVRAAPFNLRYVPSQLWQDPAFEEFARRISPSYMISSSGAARSRRVRREIMDELCAAAEARAAART
jgi:hypothetical protein